MNAGSPFVAVNDEQAFALSPAENTNHSSSFPAENTNNRVRKHEPPFTQTRKNQESKKDSLVDSPKRPDESRQIAEGMLAIWRAECGDALTVPRPPLAPHRIKVCQARFWDSFGRDLEQWRAHCRAIRASRFCCGKGSSGWRADFDWALKPKSIEGVQEGKYQNGGSSSHRRTGTYDDYEIPPLGPGGT
jgi:hypothetical protein